MKYYILVGEASADLHGSNLIKSLKKEDPDANIRCWGGDLMQDAGGELVVHYKERDFMGISDVVFNLGKISNLFKKCKKDILAFQPDVIIYIDNSGFNLRIAKWARQQGFKNYYYIGPQVWASRASRVKSIKRDIDRMYVILPFEADFYKKYDYNVEFEGHPLIDAIANRTPVSEKAFKKQHGLDNRPIIALLPGSRKQEITKILSVMLSVVSYFSEYQFVVAGAPSREVAFYNTIIGSANVKVVHNQTYDLLGVSYAALVTSGTATLETALLKVPQIVCYKGSFLFYWVAKSIVTLKYISLVNLIMDREVVTELIQKDLNKQNLKKALIKILSGEKRKQLFLDYYELETKLGGKGTSSKVAKSIVESLKHT